MLGIDVMEDDDLREVVEKFISALLPHDNYDPEPFSDILSTIFKYVRLDEFSLSLRVLLEALDGIAKLKSSFPDYKPKFTRKTFEDLLNVSIGEAVLRPEIRLVGYLQENGLDFDLKREEVFNNACQVLYGLCMDLYDRCFDLAEPSNEILNSEPGLRVAMSDCAAHQIVVIQSNILKCSGAKIGRESLNGFSDWLRYAGSAITELNSRLQLADKGSAFSLDSLQKSNEILSILKELQQPIADWGIPELDDYTPILMHRLVVLVGLENIGKTKFCVDKAVNVLLANKRVAYMCGESVAATVYSSILINYIYKRYGLIVNADHIANPEDCPEDVRKVIWMSIDEIVSSKNLTFVDSFSYRTIYEDMQSVYEKSHFDLLVIDHSCALKDKIGSLKENIDELAEKARDFKKDYPVCVLISSHPSSTAREALSKGAPITDSPTKGSQGLSGEADEVFILRSNETLDKQGLLELEVFKRRADAILNKIILKKKFEVSALVYDENMQAVDKVASLEKQEALAALTNDLDNSMYSLV